MKFRSSLKTPKHDSTKPAQVSIPQKDAIAIEPPKKVIKALYDWDGKNDPSMYLPFSAGDFLHVVSREHDADWYEACNPLRNERGLVPVTFFETVGKTVRDSGGSAKSVESTTHDSGYGGGFTPPAAATSAARVSNGVPAPGHRATRSIGKASGGLYGIVSYDFHAERPDELDAKEGEAIIVIAQSNPEWFVAKPITRLGGPGLIPVSFVEIRDMTTGKAVDDSSDAVRKAAIPRVEEWKKMAAEYKNTSIPLGTVSSSQVQSLQQGMDRMSVSNGQQHQRHNGYGHSRQISNSFQQEQQQNLFTPLRASVPRYLFADEKFHFVVECRLSNGAHWDLSRIYEDFYELQINLINAFPEEAGQVPGKPRILPYMPGPVKFVTDNISEGRRNSLDEYLRDLLRLAPHIVGSSLVRNFFAPREGDFEVDPSAIDLNEHARPTMLGQQERHSQTSQHSHNNSNYQQQPQGRQGASAQQTNAQHQYTQSSASTGPYGQSHRPQPSQPNASFTSSHSQATPSITADHNRSNPSISGPSTRQLTPTASTTTTGSTAPVKVKAWFDRDTCVVIRMPPRGQFGYQDLYQKIVERRRLEFKVGQATANGHDDAPILELEYRDENDGEYYSIEGDEDLEIATERNEKLTVAVRVREGKK